MFAMCYKVSRFVLCNFLFLLILTAANNFQTDDGVYIQSPQAGEAVQGLVQIIGNTTIDGFTSYELAFSFGNDTSETWFMIKHSNIPVNDGVLGEWDTSVLTDGNYNLRLTVNPIDASPIIVFMNSIRVRNYSPIETETPTSTSEVLSTSSIKSTSNIFTSTIPHTPQLTPTPFKKNPAEVNPAQIDLYMQRGAIFALVTLGLLGLYILLRSQR
jgi:hypothetical protein